MRQARNAGGSARPRGRPSSRSTLRKADALAREARARLVAQAEGRRWRGRVTSPTDAERRALAGTRAQESPRINARQMKAQGRSNRQIADSDLMRRILGRKVSPTRIAHIVNQKTGRVTPLEQIAEFQRKYCGPDILVPEDERSRRIWTELVYPGLEAVSLMAEGDSGGIAAKESMSPRETKAVEIGLWGNMVRLLLETRGRGQRFERLCEEIQRLVAEDRVDGRLQTLAERLRAGEVDKGLAQDLMRSAATLARAVGGAGLGLWVPPKALPKVHRTELPFGTVQGALRRLRDDLINELFKAGFTGPGKYSPHPPIVSVSGEVVQALGGAFGLSAAQVVRIVKARKPRRR